MLLHVCPHNRFDLLLHVLAVVDDPLQKVRVFLSIERSGCAISTTAVVMCACVQRQQTSHRQQLSQSVGMRHTQRVQCVLTRSHLQRWYGSLPSARRCFRAFFCANTAASHRAVPLPKDPPTCVCDAPCSTKATMPATSSLLAHQWRSVSLVPPGPRMSDTALGSAPC